MNKKYANIVGTQIGIYEVLYKCQEKAKDGHDLFHVKCTICGWGTNMIPQHIGKAKVCKHMGTDGTYKNFSVKWKNETLQHIFAGIKRRCYNPKDKAYRWYGAKGIKVCDEWIQNPEFFEEWALDNGYQEGLTIDRKDESKDYSPDNCRWITLSDNAKYKSTTKTVEVDGIERTGREWPNFLILGTNTINKMLKEYPEEQVKEFIRRRLKDKTKTRRSHQTWMNVYDLE